MLPLSKLKFGILIFCLRALICTSLPPRGGRRKSSLSMFGCGIARARRIFSRGPPALLDVSVAGWAEQFSRGFESRGLPRDVIGAMMEPSLPIVSFDEVRPDMHFRLRVYDGEGLSPRFVTRTCTVESYRLMKKADYRDEFADEVRRKKLGVKFWVPIPSCSVGLTRRTYTEQMWDHNVIAPGVMVGKKQKSTFSMEFCSKKIS